MINGAKTAGGSSHEKSIVNDLSSQRTGSANPNGFRLAIYDTNVHYTSLH
jgi:hypothetical protein